MSVLVSVIIPVYNADPYLEDCLSSIAAQTYQHIEVILINDGSTDGSSNIAKLFCNRDNRFRLVNQSNAGVAAAGQTGLNLVHGEFIIHTDSDDLMAEQSLECLYKSIVENDSNIALGAYVEQSK